MRLPSLLRRPLLVLSPLTVPLAVFAATGCVAPADVVSTDDPPVAGEPPDGGSWSGPGAPPSRTPLPDSPPAGPAGPARPGSPTSPPDAGPLPPPKPTVDPPPPPPPQPLPLPSGEITLRDTAWRGNADGFANCGDYEYHHYEEPNPAAGPQLHVVAIRSFLQGQPAVRVAVDRAGTSTLVLSSGQGATKWQVTVAPGATLERVILVGPGDSPPSAAVPPGVPVQIYTTSDGYSQLINEAAEWPSVYSADLVAVVEGLSGRPLTSFRGCNGAAGFRIEEPGEIRPPRPVSTTPKPTLPSGCERLTQESGYCVSLDAPLFFDSARIVAIGADSGEVCAGPVLDAPFDGFQTSSLGWAGDYVYSCIPERGLARISVLDGSVDVAPVACDAVTGHQGGLITAAIVSPTLLEMYNKLLRFDSFDDAARRRVQNVFGEMIRDDLVASRVATRGDRALFAWHSTSTLDVGTLSDFDNLTSLGLEGFDGWVDGFDELDDGRLLIISYSAIGEEELLSFDPQTGAFQGRVPFSGELGGGFLRGLDCVVAP